MKQFIAGVTLLAAAGVSASAEASSSQNQYALRLKGRSGVSPTQKVVQMMGDMRAKGQAELEEEAAIFKEY